MYRYIYIYNTRSGKGVGGGWDPGLISLIKRGPLQYGFFQNLTIDKTIDNVFILHGCKSHYAIKIHQAQN